MAVDFVDLRAQHQALKDELLNAIAGVIDECAFCNGPYVAAFEQAFARALGARHCVAVNSGTSALHATLMALGMGPGDEVIVPANTFFATAEAVSLSGATPVFVDCLSDTYTIDSSAVERACTPKTKAIIPVHLYGQPADIHAIRTVALNRNLVVVEDCAQAHGARIGTSCAGTFGHAGCFSFYPSKNLGACGEGGAVITNDDALSEKLRSIREHGSARKYFHDVVGHNYRMEGIQGAVLSVKLRYLEEWNESRRAAADRYRRHLGDVPGLDLPVEAPGTCHVYHLYVIRTAHRDAMAAFLKARGIQTGIHYPVPCHLQKAYRAAATGHACPVAESHAAQILSLPMHPHLTDDDARCVAGAIKDFLAGERTDV